MARICAYSYENEFELIPEFLKELRGTYTNGFFGKNTCMINQRHIQTYVGTFIYSQSIISQNYIVVVFAYKKSPKMYGGPYQSRETD